MRIGILGGTFDPPHLGHIAVAEKALEQLELDEIIFVPASRNPLKTQKQAHPKDRLEMTRLAIKDNPKFAVSDIELQRGGNSFTYDTLFELQFIKPGEYWLIVGTDALRTMDRWKNPDKLIRMARLAVAIRPPDDKKEFLGLIPADYMAAIDWLDMPADPTSSTEIRNEIFCHRSAQKWLDPNVLEYIRKKELYRS